MPGKKAPLVWRLMGLQNKNVTRIHRSRKGMSKMILLLITTGRKSGLERVTPLQYERLDDGFYVGAARGMESDWVRNILANSQVKVELRGEVFEARAEVIADVEQITDFLVLRLERRPFLLGAMMVLAHRLPPRPSREQLEKLAEGVVIVRLRLEGQGESTGEIP